MSEDHEDKFIPADVDIEMEDIKDHQVPAHLIAQIKRQVIEEMRDDAKRQEAQDNLRREDEKNQHAEFVAKMKESPDPWVEIQGWTQSAEGQVRIELDWNDAFVDELRKQGITGADEDQAIQKWLILLMQELTEEETSEYE